jgi:hypothetical protein
LHRSSSIRAAVRKLNPLFNQMTPILHVGIVVSLYFLSLFGRDNNGGLTLIKALQKPDSVMSFIAENW